MWWSWILTAVGVTGLFLAGSKRSVGWAIGLGAQLLWLAYAIATEQYGFIVSAFAYGFVYLRNMLKWKPKPWTDRDWSNAVQSYVDANGPYSQDQERHIWRASYAAIVADRHDSK